MPIEILIAMGLALFVAIFVPMTSTKKKGEDESKDQG